MLREHPHPLTNKQIHAALPGRKCDLATIYRSIKLLVETGLVDRFDFGDGVARYELAGHHSTDHHHHLICTECDRVIEIEECIVEELQSRMAAEHGFAQITHRLEFFGICPDCKPSDGKRSKPLRPRLPCGC